LLKKITAAGSIVLVSSLVAFAGKAEREFQKKELKPMIAKAEAKYRSACGCALTITVTPSIRTYEDMRQARFIARDILDKADGYCTDTESKKAMCAMRTLEIVRGKETSFTYSGTKGTATTEGVSYVNFEMITRQLDK